MQRSLSRSLFANVQRSLWLWLLATLALSGCYRRAYVETTVVSAPAPPVVYVGGPGASTSGASVSGSSGASGPSFSGAASAAGGSCAAASFAIDDCRERCGIDLSRGTSDCAGAVSILSRADRSARVSVNMSSAQTLVMELEICDPRGWVFHMSDSLTGNGWGGDAGSSSNDAEFQLNAAGPDVGMNVYASDLAQGRYEGAMQTHRFSGTNGCVTRRILVADQQLATDDGLSMCDPALLRVNPPIDTEGSPDPMWWIGIGSTFSDTSRSGAGLQRMTFCLR